MSDEKDLIMEFQKLGILKKKIECLKFGQPINNLVKRKRNKDVNELMSWRCSKCQTYKSAKGNSFVKNGFKCSLPIIGKIQCVVYVLDV
jgi:hypothetical protein